MAKEIVVWCDPCLGEDKRSASHEVRIGLDERWMTLDLCEEHEEALLVPLRALLKEFGAPVATPAARTAGAPVRVSAVGPQPQLQLLQMADAGVRKGRKMDEDKRTAQCLWCPLSYTSGSSGGFNRHLRTVHGFASQSEALGDTCPLCGRSGLGLLGSHLAKSHAEYGFQHAVQAFHFAAANGDPHGVVAQRLTATGSVDPQAEWQRIRELEKRQQR